jgi:mannose-6-phosphate isomerase
METKEWIFKLKGKVQHYAWGGFEYIPQLLGVKNKEHKPFAEYWMGAHPSASSEILIDGRPSSLYDLIQKDPSTYIGDDVKEKFNELPYLFKILDVNEMLSIQVHPSKAEALKGFEREEAEGIPIDAPHRNYKDKNHKPEVMVALSDFWLLHGFKNESELRKVLSEVPEFNFLQPVFETEGYYGLYKKVMEFPQDEVDEILAPLLTRLLNNKQDFSRTDPGYWAAKLFGNNEPLTNIDRGIFSIYFLNIMEVKPGEAVFQGAGIPHAYLYGQNVELMANSDNVLRGGLTPKHIDVPELLKHTTFEAVDPIVLKGEAKLNGEQNYPCPVEDFGLSAIRLQPGQTFTGESASAEIFIVIEGAVDITGTFLNVDKGESFIVFPRTKFQVQTTVGCLLFKAFVP